MYLLRSSPTFQHPDLLADFDDCLKSCATDICNASFDDIGWIQATLPIKLGGIGLHRASDLALPAYLASISASQSLISEITQPDNIPHALDSCLDVRSCCCVVVDPTPPTCCQQSPAPESCGSQQSLPPGGKERLHFVGIRPEVQARKGGW